MTIVNGRFARLDIAPSSGNRRVVGLCIPGAREGGRWRCFAEGICCFAKSLDSPEALVLEGGTVLLKAAEVNIGRSSLERTCSINLGSNLDEYVQGLEKEIR